ncbi:SCO family protein [Paenibacillus sp. SYP-B4298]|uniref:SCO family protein n=1 Tax=Paenibacillus sp. SYP-B4298 TaxID=2996034 RepID=UPI0022DD5E48|nr:SCO family protein [Paenibacillus sp. SYP-B4298]
MSSNGNSKISSSRPYWIALLVLVLLFGAYLLMPLISGKGRLPVVMPSPAFSMPDLDGNTITQTQYDGKIRLMSFIFTRCPDICPVTTANMVELQRKLQEKGWFGSKVAFLSATFDPDNDTPEVLRGYAERMGIDSSGWTLLRPQQEDTIRLAEQYGLSIQKLDDDQYIHSVTSLLLIDDQQQVRMIYKMGEEMDNEQVMQDITYLVDNLSKNE